MTDSETLYRSIANPRRTTLAGRNPADVAAPMRDDATLVALGEDETER
ncbi:hypothetical protein [Xylanimonas oleitrophica]|nr:hypothetical protein [Xylanimonas oleitrophica]